MWKPSRNKWGNSARTTTPSCFNYSIWQPKRIFTMRIRKIPSLDFVHKNKTKEEKLGVHRQTTKLAKEREVARSFLISFLPYLRVPFWFPAKARHSSTAPTKKLCLAKMEAKLKSNHRLLTTAASLQFPTTNHEIKIPLPNLQKED